MTDNQRNTRTLIVCFSIAFLTLIPLRFIEVGRERANVNDYRLTNVLGEQQEVVLPVADIPGLESPYREIEEQDLKSECLNQVEARELLSDYFEYLEREDVSEVMFDDILAEIENVGKKICR